MTHTKKDKVLSLAKKLKAISPDHKALVVARAWWKSGDTYKYQGADIEIMLILAVDRAESKAA